MAIASFHVSGYRSIKDLRVELGQVNVFVGPNGCGKSNLYQSLVLLAASSRGQLGATLALEGGIHSALWAGPRGHTRRQEPVRLHLSAQTRELDYQIRCGPVTNPGHYPNPDPDPEAPRTLPSQFLMDPEVKEELLSFQGAGARSIPFLQRESGTAWIRDDEGRRVTYPFDLEATESVLAQVKDPHRYPHLLAVLRELQGWRFYHQFRSDSLAAVRRPQPGVRTPVLDPEGRHLAAALQTIREVGDHRGLEEALTDAFPGARLHIESPGGRFELALATPGLARSLRTRELSDGTLRYLCLLAALLSPRPPALMAFNEPENSLHPDLLAPLARLIHRASRFSQIWVTTHSGPLAAAIEEASERPAMQLEKVQGETRIVGQGPYGPL